MNAFEIPSSGLHLTPPHLDDKAEAKPAQPAPVLRLHLLQEKTKEIIDLLKAGKPVQLQTGRQPAIQYGDHKLKLQNVHDAFPSEVYVRPKGLGDMLYFAGKLSHTLEVQQARQDTAKTDDALAALESSLKSIRAEKAMNETSFVSGREEMKMLGKDHARASPLLGGRKDFLNSKSMPGSPYQTAVNSPRPAPTSTPMLGHSTKDKIRLEAIKIAMIHLLAIRPMTRKEVADSLRAPKEDVDRLLDKHAPATSATAKRELRDRSFRDLDVWKFPYPKHEDRQAAIDRAISAFDRLRVDQNDPVWQLLLPTDERGKGKVLSKLRIDGQAPKPKPKTIDRSEAPEAETKAAKKGPEKRKAEGGGGSDAPQKKAKPSTPTATATRKRETKSGRSPATNSRIKSSERIEDSDDEAGLAPVLPAKKEPSPVKKPQVQPRPTPSPPALAKQTTSPAARKQHHRGASSTSSSAADHADGIIPKPSSKQPPSDAASSRPRHNSSPQKPSPLGSSPPTNSTDTDSSSSGKAASQSSAPTSPPSSTDMPIVKQKTKYSPVSTDNAGRSSVKRVADEAGDDRTPKKQQQQQLNGAHSSSKDSTASFRRSKPDSGQPLPSDQADPSRRQVIMEEAKRFQQCYTKYKDVYDKLAKQPEEDRDSKEVEDLIKLHGRLEKMKSEIWDNWNKIEKS